MLVATVGVVSTVGGTGAAAAQKPASGGTLTVGVVSEIATMDPVKIGVNSPQTGTDRALYVYSTLLRFDSKTSTILPGLAESVTTTDAQTWTLKLRPKVVFSDGTPLNADAVIFNYNRFKDPANVFPGVALVQQISKMTAVDPQTVEFKLSQPNGSFGQMFTDIAGAMVSPTAFRADPVGFGQRPVGAGPFILQSWNRGQQMTFVRNPNYWDKPRPYLDSIVQKVYPNSQTLAAELQAGNLDVIHLADLTARRVATSDPKTFRFWDPTTTNGTQGMVCNLDRVPCNDIRFREALSLSFDLNNAKQVFLPGVDYKPKSMVCPPFGPGSPFCAKEIRTKYDPDRARKLFAAVKADGISTDITYSYNSDAVTSVGQGEWVQQQLAKVGVTVTIRGTSTPQFIADGNAHAYQVIKATTPTAADLTTRYYNDNHSAGGPNGGRDYGNYNNAELDVALEKARNSLKLADRIEGMQTAQRIMAKYFLETWLYPFVTGNVYKAKLHLPTWVSKNDQVFRYEDAWVSNN